jgi:Tfp pilus assembly protein PilN
MIYFKTSIGVELSGESGEDILISSVQSNFSGGVFTRFTRIQNFRSRDKEDLRREVNSFFKSNRLSKDNIILGIPRKDIVLRYLDLPAEVADNLKQVVQYQVQSFEPTEEDKFYHDYALIPNESGGKRLTVMLALVRKSMLDDILKLLLESGIKPVSVLGSSMGLSNIILQKNKAKEVQDKTFILADLRSSTLELLALRNGSIVYSREIPKGDERSWKDSVLHEIGEAASKIRLGPESSLEKIILSGESSPAAYEDMKFEIPDCELIGNSIALEIPGENKIHVQEAASTIGLACTGRIRRPPIRMNLLPMERRIHQSRWAYVPTVICGIAILALLAMMGFHRMIQNQRLVRQLDEEIMALTKPVNTAHSYRKQAEELEKKARSLEELLNKRDMNLEILRELTNLLPPDTFLQNYNCKNQDGIIQITGLSPSVPDLIRMLEKSSLLKDVGLKGSTWKEQATKKDRFTIEAKLER